MQASTKDERDGFFARMRLELKDHEQTALVGLGLTWESLRAIFETAGEVRAALDNDEMAGFVWIELQSPMLYIQSLILFPEFRGRGIGTEVFNTLETEFRDRVDAMTIGTLESNSGAIRFYERSGFTPSEQGAPPGYANFCKMIAAA